jgi:4-amino-4-deoxy-L-arabinose transferase-like glycosyltransferase
METRNTATNDFMNFRKLNKSFKETFTSFTFTSRAPTTLQISIWGVFLVLTLTLSLIKFNTFQLGTYIDDANYVTLAKSFVSSPYYGLINEPLQYKQSQFPFGFPLLLSLSADLFPGNLDAMKVYALIATLINISILFWGWRLLSHMDSYWMGLIVAGLYAVFPLVIQQSTMVMSEPVFLTFYLLALVLTEQASRREEKPWWVIGMSVVIFFLAFTRTIGVVLIIGMFAYLLYVRGWRFWKQILSVIAGVIILISLIIWLTPVTPTDLLPAEYFQSKNANVIKKFSSIFSPVLRPDGASNVNTENDPLQGNNIATSPTGSNQNATDTLNVKTYIQSLDYHFSEDLRQVILPFGLGRRTLLSGFLSLQDLLKILGYLVSVLVFLGLIVLFASKQLSIFALSAFLYLAVIMLWVWVGPRLLYPILPQMQFCFVMGVAWVISTFTPSWRLPYVSNWPNLLLAGVIILLGSASIYKSIRIDDSRIHAGDVQARTDWLRANVDATARIMSEYPEVDYIYSDRNTVEYPSIDQISSSDALESFLARNQVNYILVAPQIIWQLAYSPSYSERTNAILPFIEDLAKMNKLSLVYSSDQNLIRVYERPN